MKNNSKQRRAERAERAWVQRSGWLISRRTPDSEKPRIRSEMNNIRRNHPSLNLPETLNLIA